MTREEPDGAGLVSRHEHALHVQPAGDQEVRPIGSGGDSPAAKLPLDDPSREGMKLFADLTWVADQPRRLRAPRPGTVAREVVTGVDRDLHACRTAGRETENGKHHEKRREAQPGSSSFESTEGHDGLEDADHCHTEGCAREERVGRKDTAESMLAKLAVTFPPLALSPALALSLLLVGCAGESGPRERTVLAGPGQQVSLILPLNVSAVLPGELEPYEPIVWEEFQTYLRARGKELKTLSRRTARRLWLESIREVRAPTGARAGSAPGFDEAASVMARKLAERANFAVMIVPSLFVREATLKGRSASWDGVQRRVPFSTTGLGARKLAETPLVGVAPAGSLHVAIFDTEGTKVHDALGGLEVLWGVRAVGANLSGEPSFKLVPRNDLFENREHVREAVEVAFDPFVPREQP
jgi:hypothetical protein